MDIHSKIRKTIEPKLEPGESIQQVFPAQSGPQPMLAALIWPLLFQVKYWIFAVTDRRTLIFCASFWKSRAANDLAATLPRSTRFGPVSGLWGALEIGGTRYWVHKRFQKDVQAADADAPAAEQDIRATQQQPMAEAELVHTGAPDHK
jgi:hypothetical protein